MKKIQPILILAGIGLSACSLELNEGLVRMAVPSDPTTGSGKLSPAVFTDHDGQEIIKVGEDFQITLISAFICDVREGLGGFNVFTSTNQESTRCGNRKSQGLGTRAEVAILAGFQFRSSNGGNANPEERLVFFSDDIRESGQLLNQVNLPVYGPAPYQLATSKMRVTILELDRQEAEEQSALLEKLSEAGREFASPVQGAVLGVLSSIGEIIIKSNSDDREFRFELMFDTPFGASANQSAIHRLPLREGYIAMIRRESRLGPASKVKFSEYTICPALGLISIDSTCQDGDAYLNDTTWLLFRVSKEDFNVANATLSRTLQNLMIARKGKLDLIDLNEISNALTALTTSEP